MLFIFQLLILLYSLFSLALVCSLIWSEIKGVPYVPSKIMGIELALQKISPRKHAKFIDLGSGDGRVVFLAAKKFDTLLEKVIASECSPDTWIISNGFTLPTIKQSFTTDHIQVYRI